ncbi:hypothetical protein FOXYS1_11281, partial [Fusarium oxysporum]
MSSSKGLLRHLPLPLRLWSNCSPLSVITRQTAPSVSVSQGIVNCGIFSRGLASLVNGQAKPLNSRRDNGRPMPIGIRSLVPKISDRACSAHARLARNETMTDRDVLPDNVKPKHYDLSLRDLEFTNWTYKGTVTIDSEITKPTKEIIVNT